MVEGSGSHLFKDINGRVIFDLQKTKIFKGGAIILYYHPKKD